jgi:L-alanine-DL-glutamate epimerase-like enolase superfamily enzyme
MKITGIDSAVLRIPCPKPMSLEFADHRMVAAFIDTDEGVSGFGYALAFGGGGASLAFGCEDGMAGLVSLK